MAQQDINAKIEQRVQEFTRELTELVRESALYVVQAALEGSSAAPRASRSTGAAPAPRKKAGGKKAASRRASGGTRIRRSEEEIAALGEQFVAYVSANPGQRLEEIGAGLGIPTSELKRPVSNLMDAKALRTEGQKRGTKYFIGKGRSRSKS